MLGIGLAFMILAGCIGVWEIRAVRKRLKIRTLRRAVTTQLHFRNKDWESLAISAGTTGLTLLDVYDQISNHYDVLQVLEHRYPQEMGDASYSDWLDKIESLFREGQAAVDNYINAYVGRMAEDLAAAHLQAQGLDVVHFSSQTHPDNDLRVYHPDGSYTDYSVKSYASVSEFQRAVAEHADSHHYIVNHELYEQLEQQGLLQTYSQQGIEILDGGYSNAALHEHAQRAFDQIHQAADGGHHVPIVGLFVFGFKSAHNVLQFFRREQTANELAANLVGDGIGMVARTGAGWLGWQIGASIGTMIGPGIGTIIGGGIGAFLAGTSMGSVVSYLKEQWKYGDIIKAQSRVGERYIRGFPPKAREQLQEYVYHVPELRQRLLTEKQLLERYRDQLNPYTRERPTLAAVLCNEYVRHLEAQCRRAKRAAKVAEKKILHLCHQAAEHVKHDKDEAAKRFLGDLVLSSQILLTPEVEREFAEYVHKYRQRIAKYPHHPYRFKHPARDVVQGLAIQALLETQGKVAGYPIFGRVTASLAIVTASIGVWLIAFGNR